MEDLEELVVAAQQGNTDAFGRIVDRFQDMAYFTALRYLGDQQQAQDAAQDAFIDAHRCLPTLEAPRAFPAWFRRIVFKHSHRQVRRRRPALIPDEAWDNLPAEGPGPDQMLEQMQRQQAVRAAIQALPDIYRQVTQLFYLAGHSYGDVATHLSLPVSTVKKRLYTARQLIKEKMSPMTTKPYQPSQDGKFANRVKFFIALKNNDLLQVRQLVRRDPELLTTKTEWGVASDGWYWPLGTLAPHWAASTGNIPLLALLVEHGADVNSQDQGGATPLKRAAHMGQTEAVRWLLDNGANPDVAAANGQTALHTAVIRNRPPIVDLLLAHGAETTLQDSQGRTPLDWAIAKRLPALARKLGGNGNVTWPELETPTVTTTIWETGIKIVDLIAPLKRGGRNGLFTPLSGIGSDVMMGELIHRMATYYGGTAVQLGLAHGDFTAESRMLQWRNYGVDEYVEIFFGEAGDSAARQRHVAEQGVKRALEVAAAQPVLLIVYTHLADGVMEIIDRAGAAPNVTTLFAGVESIGAEPPALAQLDAAFTFDLLRARQELWPAIDPVRSYTLAYENDEHRAVAETAVRLFKRYQDLHLIYENQGMAGFDVALYGDAERHAVIRARRLHRFLSQPLAVAESWSATPSVYVPLAETLKTTRAILEGELDDVPEEELGFIGRWSPKWT
ncbi:MAG TPA: sigma-70 family RNA polymerase sigma factor [Anaerolineae bacterium]